MGKTRTTKVKDKKVNIDSSGMRDRCWVTLSDKIQVRDYEPAEASFGYASDQCDGETIEQTAIRVIRFASKYQKILKQKMLDVKFKHNH